jgi:hypothetical protein
MLGSFSPSVLESRRPTGLCCNPNKLQSLFGAKLLSYSLPAAVSRSLQYELCCGLRTAPDFPISSHHSHGASRCRGSCPRLPRGHRTARRRCSCRDLYCTQEQVTNANESRRDVGGRQSRGAKIAPRILLPIIRKVTTQKLASPNFSPS